MRDIAVQLAVAGSVDKGIFLCCPFAVPRDVLDGILDLIESVFEAFPTYSYTSNVLICLKIIT